MSGYKADAGKIDWMLIPFDALEEVARVLMFGAEKYGAENWRDVENGERRYWNAAIRHLTAYSRGKDLDSESNLSHLAHAACNVLFVMSLRNGRIGAEAEE